MAGGSDDLGLTPALYLAQKNLIQPVQSEVDSVDYYIQHFLLDYLQAKTSDGQRTWQVYRWFDGKDGTPSDQGVWRAYNYTHIANTYFTMYQLASAHPELTTDFTATQYLTMAYNTLDAMFNDIPQPTPIGDAAHDMGLMGESTYPDILAALKKEGMTTQATSSRPSCRRSSRSCRGRPTRSPPRRASTPPASRPPTRWQRCSAAQRWPTRSRTPQ